MRACLRRHLVRCLALALLLLAALPAVAAAQSAPRISATPAPGASLAPGGWFRLPVEPGEVAVDRLVVRNDGTERLSVRVSGVDAATADRGGAAYALGDSESRETGAWLDVDEPLLTVEAGMAVTVPFSVQVPRDARSGVHLAGLSVDVLDEDVRDLDRDAAFGASVVVRTRRVIAVEVDVPGPREAVLAVTGVTPQVRPHGMSLRIGIHSTGSDLTKATGTITLPRLGIIEDFTLDTIVPGTEFGVPIAWAEPDLSGNHVASVSLEYGGRTVEWDGVVQVTDTVREQVQDRMIGGGTFRITYSPPWKAIGGGAVLAAAAMALGILRWRRADHRPLRWRRVA